MIWGYHYFRKHPYIYIHMYIYICIYQGIWKMINDEASQPFFFLLGWKGKMDEKMTGSTCSVKWYTFYPESWNFFPWLTSKWFVGELLSWPNHLTQHTPRGHIAGENDLGGIDEMMRLGERVNNHLKWWSGWIIPGSQSSQVEKDFSCPLVGSCHEHAIIMAGQPTPPSPNVPPQT